MTIQVQMYDTSTLLGVMRQLAQFNSYWLDLCFQNAVNFTDEYIDFEKLVDHRKLAPFVAPTAQGRPIYSEGSNVTRLKPACIKPKDPVNPNRMIKRRAGELLSLTPQSPGQRFNAIIGDILSEHSKAIQRRWEWMGAQAVLNGAVTVVGEDYPERLVDFGRDAEQTIVLTGTAAWNGSAPTIIENINTWRAMMRLAKFGGPSNRLTVGADAWEAMRKSAELKDQLDTRYRGTEATLNTGVREGMEVEYVGSLSGTLPVYVYSDYYEQEDGTTVQMMDPRDVVLTGPNVNGVRAFGAILDQKANFQALPIFPKMWPQEDPALAFVMSQSAPLMVPVNPNNTLRARVVDNTL
jgi:hypothetical protein